MVIKVIEVLGGQKNLNMIINYYKNIRNILLDFAEYLGQQFFFDFSQTIYHFISLLLYFFQLNYLL